jgi:ribosomal protein L11 methyltransferase
MLELFPEGFEEVDRADGIEFVAYTDSSGEERLWHSFGGVRGQDVAADWRDRWKSFHHPVRVGPLWIGPPWHDPPADATAIVIDPGRAFGTGAHPTTQLCIELLFDLEPGSVVDFGCGSGVLAIVAAKLGFAPVVALDAEASAVEATRLNAEANAVTVEVRLADALADPPPASDVALANITRPAASMLAPRLRSRRFVASGYLPTDEPSLPSFRHVRRVTRDGWAADLYEAM